MPGFLVIYNRRTGVSDVTSFLGSDGYREALKQRLALEAQGVEADIEIASLVSDSLDTVRKTHSRYFESRLAVVGS